jgi:hypothetical protein
MRFHDPGIVIVTGAADLCGQERPCEDAVPVTGYDHTAQRADGDDVGTNAVKIKEFVRGWISGPAGIRGTAEIKRPPYQSSGSCVFAAVPGKRLEPQLCTVPLNGSMPL